VVHFDVGRQYFLFLDGRHGVLGERRGVKLVAHRRFYEGRVLASVVRDEVVELQ